MAISFLQTVVVAGPAKIGHVGTDNFFYLHILSFDSTVMILSEFIHRHFNASYRMQNTVFQYQDMC